MSQTAMTPAEFEQALRAKGALYHIHHPFHRAMYEGRATREQIQGWVANRFYYQVNIPLKDAAILANCPDRETRREWIQRILDQMSPAGKLIITLLEIEERSVKEIADLTGWSVPLVKVRAFRARAEMKKILARLTKDKYL